MIKSVQLFGIFLTLVVPLQLSAELAGGKAAPVFKHPGKGGTALIADAAGNIGDTALGVGKE